MGLQRAADLAVDDSHSVGQDCLVETCELPGCGHDAGDLDATYLSTGCTAGGGDLWECNPGNYYRCAPYNDYCKWIHSPSGCPGNYCQPYDDAAAQGGYRACKATGAEVTLCAGDGPQ
jgi:hypothetical protein